MKDYLRESPGKHIVSMKSGLEDRNNKAGYAGSSSATENVSMKSGLEDRNNLILKKTVTTSIWMSQ